MHMWFHNIQSKDAGQLLYVWTLSYESAKRHYLSPTRLNLVLDWTLIIYNIDILTAYFMPLKGFEPRSSSMTIQQKLLGSASTH